MGFFFGGICQDIIRIRAGDDLVLPKNVLHGDGVSGGGDILRLQLLKVVREIQDLQLRNFR